MMRGTGGNRFIAADSDQTMLLAAIERGLTELHVYAESDGRVLDVGAITVDTKRVKSGLISVEVSADLTRGGCGVSTEQRAWPESVWPTPEQWAAWFCTLSTERQVEVAESIIRSSQEASQCFLENHEGLRGEVLHLRERVAMDYRSGWNDALQAFVDAYSSAKDADSELPTTPAPRLGGEREGEGRADG